MPAIRDSFCLYPATTPFACPAYALSKVLKGVYSVGFAFCNSEIMIAPVRVQPTAPENERRAQEPASKQYGHLTIRSLDGVRGLAILAVLIDHLARFLPSVGLFSWVAYVSQFGWAGVDLFFALSGFLISGILVRTRGMKQYFRSFYARRALRILPIYLGTLFVVSAAAITFHIPGLPDIRQFPYYALFLSNWLLAFGSATPPPNGFEHFWSLAVEEQFYIIWSLSVALIAPRRLIAVAITVACLAPLSRVAWVLIHGPGPWPYYAMVARMDSLMIGGIAGILYASGASMPRRSVLNVSIGALALFVAGVLIARPASAYSTFIETVGFSLLALGFGSWILYAALSEQQGVAQNVLQFPALRRIGRYSYGMYVYHLPLIGAATVVFAHFPARYAGTLLGAVAFIAVVYAAIYYVSLLSYELFEKRILRLKRYFEPN